MTWSCGKCGKPFLSERERDRHQGQCGIFYTLPKCRNCNGTGETYYHTKCPYCNGSGVREV